MPFLEKDFIDSGGFGTVYKVGIHPQHHEFAADRTQHFAVKSLPKRRNAKSNSTGTTDNSALKRKKTDFEKERNICQEFAANPHVHLTPFLFAWEDEENFNMLFPKAEMNLHNFFMRPSPRYKTQKIEWLLEQMYGLSEGLASIHRLRPPRNKSPRTDTPSAKGKRVQKRHSKTQVLDWFIQQMSEGLSSIQRPVLSQGKLLAMDSVNIKKEKLEQRQRIVCHHDLKPSNILVFCSEGKSEVLKIADFGLAKVKNRDPRGSNGPTGPKTKHARGDLEYISPEKGLGKMASRPSDNWSFDVYFWSCFSGSSTKKTIT